ncbi:hypothetical protein ISS30_05350 [bacterium]|nr:hypothetical protein [FCB group bacterium]MBL7191102.1 hypothetical protein [bacterium]
MLKFSKSLPIIIFIVILIGCTKPETWELSSQYRQYSHYRDRNTRAYALIVTTNDEETLRRIAEYYYDKFSDPEKRLIVDFFDDRRSTPDYSNGMELNEFQEDHLIAHFEDDPFLERKYFEMR